jgi:hypothetical protein
MGSRVRAFGLLLLTICAACGESGSNPVRPREADFQVVGTSGSPFHVVRFDATNGPPHVFDPPREFQAPFTFIFLNAGPHVSEISGVPPNPQVQATFTGAAAADDVSINLRLGFNENLTATVLIPAGADSADSFLLATPELPAPITTPPIPPEVRVEVCQQTNTTSDFCTDQPQPQNAVPFIASMGDQDTTFLTCGDSQICTSPAIFYIENPHANVGAIISKAVADDQVLLLNVYITDHAPLTARATRDNVNAKIRVFL